jgi:hypothetical protein
MLKWKVLNTLAMLDGIICILVTIVALIITAVSTNANLIESVELYMCGLPLLVGSYIILRIIANKFEPNVEVNEVHDIGD